MNQEGFELRANDLFFSDAHMMSFVHLKWPISVSSKMSSHMKEIALQEHLFVCVYKRGRERDRLIMLRIVSQAAKKKLRKTQNQFEREIRFCLFSSCLP